MGLTKKHKKDTLYYRGEKMDYKNTETKTRTIRFPIETDEKIERLAKENQRDFSKQVRFMCEEYMKMRETR